MSRHSRLVSASAWSSTTDDGRVHRCDRGAPGGTTSATPAPGDAREPKHLRLDRLDPVERDGEIGEEHGRVVVAVVERTATRPAGACAAAHCASTVVLP